jgi:DNA repair protein RadC
MTAACRTHTCGESKSALGVGAQKKLVDSSQNFLSAFGTLENLNQATGTEMCQIKAIGAAKAAQTKAPLEVEKRMASKPTRMKIKQKFSQAFV